MEPFGLRDKQIYVASASIYERCHWDAPIIEEISGAYLTIRAVVLATRTRGTLLQEPYAYIDEDPTSPRGLWLREAEFTAAESSDS